MVVLTFLKSLFSKLSLGAKDLFYIGVIIIGFLILHHSSPSYTGLNIKPPDLVKVEKKIDKNGDIHSQATEVVFTKKQAAVVSKDIKKETKLDKINSVSTFVTHVNFKSPEVPVNISGLQKIVFDKYEDKNISLSHTYNPVTQKGQFDFHLTPDTVTFVRGQKTHLFRANENKIDIKHSNKLFNDTLATSYTWKEDKVVCVIGPSFGIQYDFLNKKVAPVIGFTITYNLLGFKKHK